MRILSYYISFAVLLLLSSGKHNNCNELAFKQPLDRSYSTHVFGAAFHMITPRNILVENYFQFMDSVVEKYDDLTPYKLSEHLIAHANSWILDTLQNTDYYLMKARDSFVYDQRKMIVLPKGSTIIIPDSGHANTLVTELKKFRIDINIPEYKLRIFQDATKLYEFDIRVGRDEKKFLAMSGRIEDLRTKTGEGRIVHFFKDPGYFNPVDNKQYFVTKRDDGKTTKLPKIPFLETEINGRRYGQLIHPTTNPSTLGKAYSNGCIGTREADAWTIYYYAPIQTKINIRYDLEVIDDQGKQHHLEDIYGYGKSGIGK
ncbi:L,D-transpeptidase [Gaetbulibacter sp. M240]|uniref:L,D-transpeptidase n=1 Tax=Gaetbulibacter sp. M240 TaxID=3126511 RepID=UPI00374F9DB0